MLLIIIDKISNNICMEKCKLKLKDILLLIGVGLVAGFINGFFGAGGGLLLVPMITFVAKIDVKKAHATTLFCVLFMCLCSSIIYMVKKQVDYMLVLYCLIGGIAGSLVGTFLLQKLKNNVIDLLFSIALIAAGVFMIVF